MVRGLNGIWNPKSPLVFCRNHWTYLIGFNSITAAPSTQGESQSHFCLPVIGLSFREMNRPKSTGNCANVGTHNSCNIGRAADLWAISLAQKIQIDRWLHCLPVVFNENKSFEFIKGKHKVWWYKLMKKQTENFFD